MKAKLIVICGDLAASEYELFPPVILGRGRKAGMDLPHRTISRQHCQFYEIDDQLIVSDLGSTNGTIVNQSPISTPAILRSGDTITLGSVVFRVELIDARGAGTETSGETEAGKSTVDLAAPRGESEPGALISQCLAAAELANSAKSPNSPRPVVPADAAAACAQAAGQK